MRYFFKKCFPPAPLISQKIGGAGGPCFRGFLKGTQPTKEMYSCGFFRVMTHHLNTDLSATVHLRHSLSVVIFLAHVVTF